MTKLGKKDAVVAILCLRVDDGLLVADPTVLKEIRQKIDGHFNIKEWQQLGEKPSLYLGMKLSYVNGKFTTDMKDYILEINFAKLEEVPCGRLLDAGLREFRRLVAQLRWPVHLVMPEFLFSVSAMAQRVGKATLEDLKTANGVLKAMQEAARHGQARLTAQGPSQRPVLVTFFDASLGKTASNAAQRGEVHWRSRMSSSAMGRRPSLSSTVTRSQGW